MLVLDASSVGVKKSVPGDILFGPYEMGELAGGFEHLGILRGPKRGSANVLEFSLARWDGVQRHPLQGHGVRADRSPD
jgi:hypothetical protein